MTFGSDEFFSFLKQGATEGHENEYWTKVFEVVKSDIAGCVRMRVPVDHQDDVFQIIFISFWMNLNKFLANSEDLEPNQRNRWLMLVANNKAKDYMKRLRMHIEQDISIDDDDNYEMKHIPDRIQDPHSSVELEERKEGCAEQLFHVIRLACTFQAKIENVLYYIYGKMIFLLSNSCADGSDVKGDWKFAYRRVVGKTLQQAMYNCISELELCLQRPLPSDLYISLWFRVFKSGKSNKVIEVDERQVLHRGLYISRMIQKRWNDYVCSIGQPYYVRLHTAAQYKPYLSTASTD